MKAKDGYRAQRTLTNAIVSMLWIDLAVHAMLLVTELWYMSYLRGLFGTSTDEFNQIEMAPVEFANMFIALFFLLITLALVVMVGRWTYVAGWNARHLGAARMTVSPGMAVGWHFVPFANLVMPFRAMREIWLASHDPAGWTVRPVGLLTGWWALWLLSSIVSNVAARLSMSADTVDQMYWSEAVGVAGTVLGAAGILLFLPVVTRLQRAQERAHAVGGMPVPPPADGVAA